MGPGSENRARIIRWVKHRCELCIGAEWIDFSSVDDVIITCPATEGQWVTVLLVICDWDSEGGRHPHETDYSTVEYSWRELCIPNPKNCPN